MAVTHTGLRVGDFSTWQPSVLPPISLNQPTRQEWQQIPFPRIADLRRGQIEYDHVAQLINLAAMLGYCLGPPVYCPLLIRGKDPRQVLAEGYRNRNTPIRYRGR